MPGLRGILFDKDGTLLDFNGTWLPVYQKAAELVATLSDNSIAAETLLSRGGYNAENKTWTADSLLAAGSNQDILKHWEEQSGLIFSSRQLAQIKSLFDTRDVPLVPVSNDLPAMMQSLVSDGYLLGVATMDDESSARESLDKLGVLDFMNFVCGADSGFGSKPDAGMIHAFCAESQLQTGEIIMVGDSPRDLLMAANAGAGLAVGVLSGTSTQQDLEPYSDKIMNNISDLRKLLHDIDHTSG